MVGKLLKVPKDRKRGVHATKRQGWRERIKELVWPSMGWKALGRLVLLKLRREAASPHKVAFGVAIGVGISFFPLPGMGLLLAALLAWGLGASIPAAMLGQVVGNPWTFPLIFWSTYRLGKLVWPGDHTFHLAGLRGMNGEYVMTHLPGVVHNLVIPLFIGGALLGGVLALVTYALVYRELWRFGMKRKKVRDGKNGK
jgi:uncharacterized protein (DUF2062 family)